MDAWQYGRLASGGAMVVMVRVLNSSMVYFKILVNNLG